MDGAVDVARENARRLGLDVAVFQADGLPRGDFDLVLANLPYVTDDEMGSLPPEIRLHEPLEARVEDVARDAEALLKATAEVTNDRVQEVRSRTEKTLRWEEFFAALRLSHLPDGAIAPLGVVSTPG